MKTEQEIRDKIADIEKEVAVIQDTAIKDFLAINLIAIRLPEWTVTESYSTTSDSSSPSDSSSSENR